MSHQCAENLLWIKEPDNTGLLQEELRFLEGEKQSYYDESGNKQQVTPSLGISYLGSSSYILQCLLREKKRFWGNQSNMKGSILDIHFVENSSTSLEILN